MAAVVTIAVTLVVVVAVITIGVARAREAASRVDDDVALAAFLLSESPDPREPDVDLRAGADVVAVVFDENGAIIGRRGDVSAELGELLREEIWRVTVEEDVATIVELDDQGLVASGVRCIDLTRCDTAVVAARPASVTEHLAERWGWLVGISLAAGAATWFGTRWLVSMSLRPVDRMRAELDDITGTDLARRLPLPGTGDELDRLGRSMNRTIDRLAGAVDANERFVADAAHELRSPITGVRAALELEASRAANDLIDDSIVELDRAGRLVDDLLTLARRQSQERPRRDVDVDDVVAHQVTVARARFPAVDIETHHTPIRISAPPDDVDRIVANLIENACRHGGGAVSVSLTSAADIAELIVDDDGPGIAIEDRPLVFERFGRLDASRSRSTGGSGLGLAIVAELVGDLAGTVSISDSAMGGASFRVQVPIRGGG